MSTKEKSLKAQTFARITITECLPPPGIQYLSTSPFPQLSRPQKSHRHHSCLDFERTAAE
jgi:hypothetical protein